jgi:chemotaxis protein CheC
MEIDALKEMGNVTTGNAATSLSKLINKNVGMNIPDSRFVPIGQFTYAIGGPERIVATSYLQLSGDLKGEALFIFPVQGALELVDIMMGRPVGGTKVMDDMDLSAFKEMSNILTGAFLNSISKMLDVTILPSIPHVATDMAQSLVDFILIKVSRHADEIFCVTTKIDVEGHHVNGDFLILFDQASLKTMIEIMHRKYGMM